MTIVNSEYYEKQINIEQFTRIKELCYQSQRELINRKFRNI